MEIIILTIVYIVVLAVVVVYLRGRYERVRAQNVILQERLRAGELMAEQLERERGHQNEIIDQKFKLFANEVLEQKSRAMSAANKEGVQSLLKPFGESMDKFRERIEQESRHRFALQEEVKRLAELNLRMSKEANNLVAALKGNSKSQGDWGEMILQTLLESSGLQKDVHFTVQESLRDQEGGQLRPDVILNLPEGKQVVIDSKVSLTAYVSYTEAEDDLVRAQCLTAHINSLKKHIAELGTKSYHKLVASPDFVIMFVPNEPALLLGLQGDQGLWHYAYRSGVILSSPTNLFAILRIVEDLWRRDSQSRNALEIAKAGGDLYDKFVGFVEGFEDIGRSIKRTDELFDKSRRQMSEGPGNLLRRAENLRELGAKTNKKLGRGAADEEQEN